MSADFGNSLLSPVSRVWQQKGSRGEFTILIGPRATVDANRRARRRLQEFSDMALDDDDDT
jgi:hypothetical protein